MPSQYGRRHAALHLPCVRNAAIGAAAALLTLPASAIVVRGRVTDPLGKGVAGARVRLVQTGKVVAFGVSQADGSYEIRSAAEGRFTLLGAGNGYLPAVGQDFYGGATDVLRQDVVLSALTVKQEVSVSATGIPTPLPQLTAPVSVLNDEAFAYRVSVVDEMRQTLGAAVVQSGQYGGVTSLFLRGGNSTANLVTVDGMPANDVGGTFDFANVSTTGVSRMEIYRAPDSATWGTDAGAGVVAIQTPRGYALRPQLDYRGEGGNLTTYRNEVVGSGTFSHVDYLAGFSRLDASNALPRDRYHDSTEVANIGFAYNANTLARVTLRNSDSAVGLPGAHDFYGVSSDGKQADQDLYGTATVENTWKTWHNLARYGIARKREQATYFTNQGTPIDLGGFTEYFGNILTIRGANGYIATGQAAFLTGNSETSSNRDQLYYQSDWSPSRYFNVLFGFRYDDERGGFASPASAFSGPTRYTTNRTNFEYNLQMQGEFFGRLTYSLGGAIEKNHLYGLAGTPRFGLGYVLVRPGPGLFRGTRLRASAATGVQEPTLALEHFSLYGQLPAATNAALHIGPPDAERSRNYDIGIEQGILGQTLTFKGGYFHNVFDRQLEGVSGSSLQQYFGLSNAAILSYLDYYVNSLAYRAQGLEGELDYQPTRRVVLRAGYTYLNARVLQSFSGDAVDVLQGFPNSNPNLPGIAIGAESPLIGARPFRRPPQSGFFSGAYSGVKWGLQLKGAFASRADDSTFLDGYTPSFDNSLLLPNRDLDFGYLKLDLGANYEFRRHMQVYAQVDNILNDQHIGPIGYPGLPLTVRGGLKVRIGGD